MRVWRQSSPPESARNDQLLTVVGPRRIMSSPTVCFVCNLPILTHQVTLAFTDSDRLFLYCIHCVRCIRCIHSLHRCTRSICLHRVHLCSSLYLFIHSFTYLKRVLVPTCSGWRRVSTDRQRERGRENKCMEINGVPWRLQEDQEGGGVGRGWDCIQHRSRPVRAAS